MKTIDEQIKKLEAERAMLTIEILRLKQKSIFSNLVKVEKVDNEKFGYLKMSILSRDFRNNNTRWMKVCCCEEHEELCEYIDTLIENLKEAAEKSKELVAYVNDPDLIHALTELEPSEDIDLVDDEDDGWIGGGHRC